MSFAVHPIPPAVTAPARPPRLWIGAVLVCRFWAANVAVYRFDLDTPTRIFGGLGAAILLELAFFVFQAEDGIRAGRVTGVQTCALPICLLSIFGRGQRQLRSAAQQAALLGRELVLEAIGIDDLLPLVGSHRAEIADCGTQFLPAIDRKSVV